MQLTVLDKMFYPRKDVPLKIYGEADMKWGQGKGSSLPLN
jgi:hypothetical protein